MWYIENETSSLFLQKVAGDGLLDRMTDTSKYTGTHKQRFDESGKGRGLEGRESVAKGPGHVPSLVSSQPSYVTGNKIGPDAIDSARAQDSPKSRAKVATAAAVGAAHPSPKTSGTKTSGPQSTAKSSPRVQAKAGGSPGVKASTKTKTTLITTSSPKASPKSKQKV